MDAEDERFLAWYSSEEYEKWVEKNTWLPVWKTGGFDQHHNNEAPTFVLKVRDAAMLTAITPFLNKQGMSISVRVKTRDGFKYSVATDKGLFQMRKRHPAKEFDVVAIQEERYTYPRFPGAFHDTAWHMDPYWNPFYPPQMPYQPALRFKDICEIRINVLPQH